MTQQITILESGDSTTRTFFNFLYQIKLDLTGLMGYGYWLLQLWIGWIHGVVFVKIELWLHLLLLVFILTSGELHHNKDSQIIRVRCLPQFHPIVWTLILGTFPIIGDVKLWILCFRVVKIRFYNKKVLSVLKDLIFHFSSKKGTKKVRFGCKNRVREECPGYYECPGYSILLNNVMFSCFSHEKFHSLLW